MTAASSVCIEVSGTTLRQREHHTAAGRVRSARVSVQCWCRGLPVTMTMALWSSRWLRGGRGAAATLAALALLCAPPPAAAAPAGDSPAGTQDVLETKSDLPVKQLEQLKAADKTHAPSSELTSEHEDHHKLETAAPATEAVPPAPAPVAPETPDEITTKVFHGAARLVQAGAGAPPPALPVPAAAPAAPAHTAARRSFNADLIKETQHNKDHFSAYSGVQYSPLDMAEYVLWTGDERAVTAAVEGFIQDGLMTKEEAIAFLQEIKAYLEYLRTHLGGGGVEDRSRTLLDQANKDWSPSQTTGGWPPLALSSSGDIARAVNSRHWELNNALSPYPALPAFRALPLSVEPTTPDLRPWPRYSKRDMDPMLQSNMLGAGEYDREAPAVPEDDYEELMERIRLSDSVYNEYSLEEVIYQLAKMMFAQSVSREPGAAGGGAGAGGAGASARRFLTALETQAQRGKLSRSIEKKVLDIMIAALTDTIGEHPELLQAREGYGIPAHRIMHDYLEASAGRTPMRLTTARHYGD